MLEGTTKIMVHMLIRELFISRKNLKSKIERLDIRKDFEQETLFCYKVPQERLKSK